MDSNNLTAAEIKRRGMAAIEEGLKHGPVHIIKRNKAAAVVVSAVEYERLATAAGRKKPPGMSAMQWLLAHPAQGRSNKRELDRRLRQERDW